MNVSVHSFDLFRGLEVSGPVLIIEEYVALRAALRSWLEMSFPQYSILEPVGLQEALRQIDRLYPQFVLVDLDLDFADSIQVVRLIKSLVPETVIILLTPHEGECYREDALRAGASACVVKHKMYADLIPTLNELLDTGGLSGSLRPRIHYDSAIKAVRE